MKISPVMRLKNNLLADKDYIKFKEIYNRKKIVDKKLLIKLVDSHFDLYCIFLKMNIFIFGYNTDYLNRELQDFLHYKGKKLRIDDLDIIFRLYYKNFSMYRHSIKKIITYKLRPNEELEILKRILNRPFKKELSVFFEYKVTLNK